VLRPDRRRRLEDGLNDRHRTAVTCNTCTVRECSRSLGGSAKDRDTKTYSGSGSREIRITFRGRIEIPDSKPTGKYQLLIVISALPDFVKGRRQGSLRSGLRCYSTRQMQARSHRRPLSEGLTP